MHAIRVHQGNLEYLGPNVPGPVFRLLSELKGFDVVLGVVPDLSRYDGSSRRVDPDLAPLPEVKFGVFVQDPYQVAPVGVVICKGFDVLPDSSAKVMRCSPTCPPLNLYSMSLASQTTRDASAFSSRNCLMTSE